MTARPAQPTTRSRLPESAVRWASRPGGAAENEGEVVISVAAPPGQSVTRSFIKADCVLCEQLLVGRTSRRVPTARRRGLAVGTGRGDAELDRNAENPGGGGS